MWQTKNLANHHGKEAELGVATHVIIMYWVPP